MNGVVEREEMRGEVKMGRKTKLQMNKLGAGALKEIIQEDFDRQNKESVQEFCIYM